MRGRLRVGLLVCILAPGLTHAQLVADPDRAAPHELPRDACAPYRAAHAPDQVLRVRDCAEVDPATIDVRARSREMDSCSLGAGLTVTGHVVPDDPLNPRITVQRGEETLVEFIAEPRVEAATRAFGHRMKLACDGEGRFYVLQPITGHVSAFNREAKLLWQQELPGFVSMVPYLSAETELDDVSRLQETLTSFGAQISYSDGFLAVELKTGGAGTRHLVYHTSGPLIGEVRTADARIVGTTSRGWRLVAGGGLDIRFYTPDVEFELEIVDRAVDSVIRHGLAWLRPRPTDREPRFHCLARSNDELEYWLGDDYRESHAEQAKLLLSGTFDESWYRALLASPSMGPLVQDFQPSAEAWQAAYHRALLAEAVDVWLAGRLTNLPAGNASAVPSPGATALAIRKPSADESSETRPGP